MCLNDMLYLFLNACMPYDRNTEDPDYIEVIDSGKDLILTHNSVYIIFGGHLNTDLVRTSRHARELNQGVEDCDFNVCTDSRIADVPYTFINSTGAKSRIVHFLVSDNLSECVSEYCIIDNHLFSDHVLLKLTLDVNIEYNYTNERSFNVQTAWHKATDDDIAIYKKMLDEKLAKIELDIEAFCCKNVFVILTPLIYILMV